jgi:hypothetical protein
MRCKRVSRGCSICTGDIGVIAMLPGKAITVDGQSDRTT